ncbi:MAG: NAD(P)-binding domain-containing protein [Shinella sp.]|nr:NAD(P)-binding domain-containing protein [Shinella sp.]
MKIGILGSGLMGGKLGVLFARAGHDVVFSYARRFEKLEELAGRAGGTAAAGTVSDAVRNADAVLLAVHWSNIDDVLSRADDLDGKTIVSCCVPLSAANTELIVGLKDSGAELLARKVPEARIAAAFQTTPSEVLPKVFEMRRAAARANCVYCGDDRRAKAVAAGLVADVGFEPVDAGPLRIARYIEPFAMLTAQLAYGTDQGPDWAYRFGKVGAAGRQLTTGGAGRNGDDDRDCNRRRSHRFASGRRHI